MLYTPVHAVWEITYACNMRCKHCGSGCGDKYPDELTTAEALQLCDDLADLGLKRLTLSGGEPFLRQDWPLLTRRLRQRGVVTNVISNGWYLTPELLTEAREAGITNVGVSLDGLEETHDYIRKPGAYKRVLAALDTLADLGIPACVNTSINRRNLPELPGLKEVLLKRRVQQWQFQLATPMGNLLEHRELIIQPGEIDQLVDFIYTVMQEGRITAYLADDIGYYSKKDLEIRKACAGDEDWGWAGCHAGKSVLGIRANGDISGCLSIRDNSFIEDNIRRVPLKEIWTRPGAFAWNREFKLEKMTGFCRVCQFNTKCKGGCGGAKISFNNSIYENRYCSYCTAMEETGRAAAELNDFSALMNGGKQYCDAGLYQAAEQYFSRALDLQPDNLEVKAFLGFVHYFLRNYPIAAGYNMEILAARPQDAYAHKGLGLCLVKTGRKEQGLSYLFKAVRLDPDNPDYYLDLAVTLQELGQSDRARDVLHQMRNYSPVLKKASEELYAALKPRE